MKKRNPSLVWACHTAAGYATFFALSTWLPLGLHRIVMRRGRWWLFPVLFALCIVGALGFTKVSQSLLWGVLMAPYMGLLINDCLSLWSWEWSFDWTPRDKLRRWNARYNLTLHLSLAVVILVAGFYVPMIPYLVWIVACIAWLVLVVKNIAAVPRRATASVAAGIAK